MMRQFVLTAAVILMVMFVSLPSAEAGRRARQNRGYNNTRVYQTAPQTGPYRAWRGGFFNRLLEFERRKNEFLFGRFWR